jgi:hypothetical protein
VAIFSRWSVVDAETAPKMVLSMLLSLGAVIGGTEGIKQAQRKSKREEHRSRKNNLIVHCPKSSQYSPYLEGRRIVLSGDKV